MRLLHITDIHFKQGVFEWVAAQAHRYDWCCLSGDLIDLLADWQTSPAAQARWVKQWVRSFPSKLAICSGNHDWWTHEGKQVDPMAEAGWIRELASPKVLVDGQGINAGGYQLYCKPWVGDNPVSGNLPQIVLAHAAPPGLAVARGVEGDVGDFETEELFHILPKGSIVLSGHVHHPDAWHAEHNGVNYFNPGVALRGGEYHYIEIDTEARRACYFGVNGDVYRW